MYANWLRELVTRIGYANWLRELVTQNGYAKWLRELVTRIGYASFVTRVTSHLSITLIILDSITATYTNDYVFTKFYVTLK